MLRSLLTGLFLLALVFPAGAQPDTTAVDTAALAGFYDLPLTALDSLSIRDTSNQLDPYINSPVSVAAKKRLSSRNAPGIITLITEEEIRNAGARDLIDILRLVPGFAFALDEAGRVGIGVRGNWANEGKVLLLIDGLEMNDIYSGGLSFGHHYPAEMIKRIEIIRGPGSAVYGGFAGFAVIKVETYNGYGVSGLSAGLTRGSFGTEPSRRNRRFYVGKNWKGLTLNFSAFQGEGQRSNRPAFGRYLPGVPDSLGVGTVSSLAGQSGINPAFTQFHLRLGRFEFRTIGDFYDITDLSRLDATGARPVRRGIRTAYNEFRYNWSPSEAWNFTARYHTILQFPEFRGLPDSVLRDQSRNTINRNRLNFSASYDPSHRVHWQFGVESFRDFASANVNRQLQPVGREDVSYFNTALFGQGIFHLPVGYLTAGLRYDANTTFGQAWVPRLAYTGKTDRLHLKLLASGGFRAPSIGNVAGSFTGSYRLDSGQVIIEERGLAPERTFVLEAEAGWQVTRHLFFTASAYEMWVRDPITYTFFQDSLIRAQFGPQAGLLVYQNADRGGTRGLELDLRFRTEQGYLNANYAFYSTGGKAQVPDFRPQAFAFDPAARQPQPGNLLLGFAQHRLNLNACLYLRPNFSLNATASYFSRRLGYDISADPADPALLQGSLVEAPPQWLAHLYLRYQDFILKGVDLGVGVYDVFNQGYTFYQPYFGLEAPLPGAGREVSFSLSMDLTFKDRKEREN